MRRCVLFVVLILSMLLAACSSEEAPEKVAETTVVITDAAGRQVRVPLKVDNVICSGPGCLRYLCYLQAQDKVVAVDSIESRKTRIDARPYAIANKQFRTMPIFGEFRGRDNPELIAGLSPQPQVIFKTYGSYGYDPVELQKRTGIPVVVLDYGDLGYRKEPMDQALRLMGRVMGQEERAEEVIKFFDNSIEDLKQRTAGVPESERPSCYVGGIAFKGPHGFRSTEPGYAPFLFLDARNVAAPTDGSKPVRHADIAKEKIVEWNPDVIFVDLSTIRAGSTSNALYEMATDPSYRSLDACGKKQIHGVLPYNWYTSNHGNTLANSYYIGKVLYPEQFADIDPVSKADEIYTSLVGAPVFKPLNKAFENLAFQVLDPDVIRVDDNARLVK